ERQRHAVVAARRVGGAHALGQGRRVSELVDHQLPTCQRQRLLSDIGGYVTTELRGSVRRHYVSPVLWRRAGAASDRDIPKLVLEVSHDVAGAATLAARARDIAASVRRPGLLCASASGSRRLALALLLQDLLADEVGCDGDAVRDLLAALDEAGPHPLDIGRKLLEQRLGRGHGLVGRSVALVQELICDLLLVALMALQALIDHLHRPLL